MAIHSFRFILTMMVAVVVSTEAGMQSGEVGDQLEWLHGGRACESSMGECMGGEEMGMQLEVKRQILQAASQSIVYGVLNKGRTLCSVTGASYYNCRPGAAAHPYTRSCSVITNCART